MNIASVIILLQMAVSLLATPNMPPNVQAQAISFANQAVILANEALQQPSTTQLGSLPTSNNVTTEITPQANLNITYTPPVQQSQALGSAPVSAPAPKPTCTITGTAVSNPSIGMGINGNIPYVTFTWTFNGTDNIGQNRIYLYNLMDQVGYDGAPLIATQKYPQSETYKAQIGGATCYASFPDLNKKDGGILTIGEISTSTIPSYIIGY